ncbi:MAG: response regulator [Gemmatimonadaceae bacterium]
MRTDSAARAPTRTALVVDDEREVRGVLRRYFERSGWDVREAETAEQALDLLGETSTPFDLVLCDLHLPGLSGSALCARVAALRPELASRFVLTSGDPGAAADELARASLICPILEKPFSLVAIQLVLSGALVAA